VGGGARPLVAGASHDSRAEETELAMSDLLSVWIVGGGAVLLIIVGWCWFLWHDAREMLIELDRQNDR